MNRAPREGTRLRECYDLLQANKGIPVEWRRGLVDSTAVIYLSDYYGLDIRLLQKGDSRTGRKPLYVLAGEWFGKVYVDYIAEQVARNEVVQ